MRGPRAFRTTEIPASPEMDGDEIPDTGGTPPSPGAADQAHRPAASVQADLAGLSHRGKVRPNNEDHFLVVRFGRFLQTVPTNLPDGQAPPTSSEAGYGLIVADGMGGKAAGEVASRLAIAAAHRARAGDARLDPAPDDALMGGDRPVRPAVPGRERRGRRGGPARAAGLAGMGTTLTMALSLGDRPVRRPRRRLAGLPVPRRASSTADPRPHRGPGAGRRRR